MQDKGAAGAEAVQAFRARVCDIYPMDVEGHWLTYLYSGDKKTKGAALVF